MNSSKMYKTWSLVLDQLLGLRNGFETLINLVAYFCPRNWHIQLSYFAILEWMQLGVLDQLLGLIDIKIDLFHHRGKMPQSGICLAQCAFQQCASPLCFWSCLHWCRPFKFLRSSFIKDYLSSKVIFHHRVWHSSAWSLFCAFYM